VSQAGTTSLIDVTDLHVHFGRRGRAVRAVDGVSLSIAPGETLGLIGESGSGKSTVGLAMLGLLEPTVGAVHLQGDEPWRASRTGQLPFRRQVQAVFQDPSEALDPRMTVAESVGEPLRVNGVRSHAERERRVAAMLERVGLDPRYGQRRPHELSGGQKQRVNIARALMLEPKVIVCDEAVSALDVSIQADILNLLVDLQQQASVAYLFISHDVGVVAHIADRIAVMYLGRVVEIGDADDVLSHPSHPYTRSLLAAAPQAMPSHLRRAKPPPLKGDIPSPAEIPPGCRFQTRCPMVHPQRCRTEDPALRPVTTAHAAACHFFEEMQPQPSSPERPKNGSPLTTTQHREV
jgi:oligopeptide/dipeptide ABC transporter ATP-binding protein